MEDNNIVSASGDVKEADLQNVLSETKPVFEEGSSQFNLTEKPSGQACIQDDKEKDIRIYPDLSETLGKIEHLNQEPEIKKLQQKDKKYEVEYSNGDFLQSTVSIDDSEFPICYEPFSENLLPEMVAEYEKGEPENNDDESASNYSSGSWETETEISSEDEKPYPRSRYDKSKQKPTSNHKIPVATAFNETRSTGADIEYYDLHEVVEDLGDSTNDNKSTKMLNAKHLFTRIGSIFHYQEKKNKILPSGNLTESENSVAGTNKKSFCTIM